MKDDRHAGEETKTDSVPGLLATILPHPEADPSSLFRPDERLVTLYRRDSAWYEQYQKLRVKLLKTAQESGISPKVLLVTSALPEEGKSLTALNLSLVLQSAGNRRVLLVEADLRRPRIQNLLRRPPRYGLVDILKGEVSLETALGEFRGNGFRILAGGPPVNDPAQLLESSRWEEILKRVRDSYDFVIIDSSPSLPFPDTSILSRKADGIVMVVRMGVTPREMVLSCIHGLDRDKLLGIVANDIRDHDIRRYYSYYGTQ